MSKTMAKQHPAYKVAAVQASPGFLDLGEGVERSCGLIAEAAANGAKLVAFPETFLPGFPFWIFESGPYGRAGELFRKFHDNAVEIPSDAVRRISLAARNGGIYVAIGVSERDGGSLYMTQLWFDDQGNLIGKHRKLKPTGPERYIWGEGDGSTMPVFKTPLGNLGGLSCWENRIPLAATVMASMHEEVHVAAWPYIGPYTRGNLAEPEPASLTAEQSKPALPNESTGFEVTNRAYAMATQTFVLAPTMVMTQNVIDGFCAGEESLRAKFKTGVGTSRIIGPDGVTIGDILPPDREGLIFADISLERIVYAKYMCDPVGHYGTPHVMSANFNRNPAPVGNMLGDPGPRQTLSYEELQS